MSGFLNPRGVWKNAVPVLCITPLPLLCPPDVHQHNGPCLRRSAVSVLFGCPPLKVLQSPSAQALRAFALLTAPHRPCTLVCLVLALPQCPHAFLLL